jgi:DNA transformation protein
MATSEDYLAFVQERLSPIIVADYRKMFGGVGVFDQGTMFALITSDDELFFRVDDRTRPGFETAGSSQFMSMPYFSSPADALEDEGALTALIEDALAASKRAAQGKGKRRPKGSSGAR